MNGFGLSHTEALDEIDRLRGVGAELLDEIDRLSQAMNAVLDEAARLVRPCKRCGERLYFVQGRRGALIPFTADGRNHFTNCPHANEFHKKRAATQEALFDAAPIPD